METQWIEHLDKQAAYDMTLDFAQEHGIKTDNSATVTLLFKPGALCSIKEVQSKVELYLSNIKTPAVASIEPVLTERGESLPNLYRYAGFKNFELLPLYHVHILLIENKYEIREQRKKWERIIKCKRKNLFQCKYIETSIRQTTNYITKFFEEKREKVGVIGFYVPINMVSAEQTQLKIEIDPNVNNSDLPCETISAEVVMAINSQIIETVFSETYSPNYLIKVIQRFSEYRFQLFYNVVIDISRFIRPP